MSASATKPGSAAFVRVLAVLGFTVGSAVATGSLAKALLPEELDEPEAPTDTPLLLPGHQPEANEVSTHDAGSAQAALPELSAEPSTRPFPDAATLWADAGQADAGSTVRTTVRRSPRSTTTPTRRPRSRPS